MAMYVCMQAIANNNKKISHYTGWKIIHRDRNFRKPYNNILIYQPVRLNVQLKIVMTNLLQFLNYEIKNYIQQRKD